MSDELKSVLPRIPPGDIKHGANMREIGSTWNQSGAATLVKYDSVCRALAEVKSIDEVLEIRNASIAMKAYAKQANNHELERDAIEIRMRATRRMDQMRQEQARTIGLAKGGQPYQKKSTKPIFSFDETDENISEVASVSTEATTVPVETIPTLAEAGIDKHLAQEGRKLGALSDTDFERAVSEARSTVGQASKKAVNTVEAETRREQRRKTFNNAQEIKEDGYEYRIGRAQDMLGDIKGTQLILTDPPCSDDADDLYSWLADFAEKVLIPGGSLILFTGHHRLPRDFEIFKNKLRFWWLLSLRHNESKRLPGKFVVGCHTPVLWFVKERRCNNEYIMDVLTSEGRDKDEHDWGQGEAGVTALIDALTNPGELIVDPFAGSGLWGRIAVSRKRRWIGCDIQQGGTTT